MFLIIFLLSGVSGIKLPGDCEPGLYYEPSMMDCMACPANASLVTSVDGFGCSCAEHSIRNGVNQCRPCNVTEVVSSDGATCVPRRCQSSSGRIVCRKCPSDYISVTQNFDGSSMKEVQCVKCARGYKAQDNHCVLCETCSCGKHELILKGRCVSKKYVLDRPKYNENVLHPNELLEIVKLEYLCTLQDLRSCRALASLCIRNFYSTHEAGPCRLWIQPKLINFKGLPLLTIDSSKNKVQFSIERGQNIIKIAAAVYTSNGGFELLQFQQGNPVSCLPPIEIKIGDDVLYDCHRNISELSSSEYGDVYELYLSTKDNLKPLPIIIRKPIGYYLQKETWATDKFRKFFLINRYFSTTTNTTNVVYLRTLLVRVRVERDLSKSGSLGLHLNIEAHYSTKSHLSDIVLTTLKVEHDMPTAGVLRGIEIWGAVLGVLSVLYASVQWRGAVRRGGLNIALLPLLAGSVADALYFATFISTLHALAAEAGTLGITLPLSNAEEHIIRSLIYAALALKILKILWINWKQCRCDIFFVDWSDYNTQCTKDIIQESTKTWKASILAREWSRMQAKRRVSPDYTVTATLLVLHFVGPWQLYLPSSQGYKWVVAAIAWWCSYSTLFGARLLIEKFMEPPTALIPRVCTHLELSLLVFQEEFYAHYVNGRNEDANDLRSMTHPLSACRIICSSQVREVYTKMTTGNLLGHQSNRVVLSKFLAAFFERALDGLGWVASERTVFERLLDVELIAREGGNTSVLLYDPDINIIPSCFAVSWWGEEWTLASFDAMLFSCVIIATQTPLLAALCNIIIWQIMKYMRTGFGNLNQKRKTGVII